MYCTKCGAAIQPGQRFCGGCGTSIGGVIVGVPSARNRVAENIKLLAILWMAISAIRLFPGLLLMTVGSAASFLPDDVPPFVPALLHGIAVFLLAGGAIGLFTGWGLLSRQPWARPLALVLGFLGLIEPPFGTALGIYTLWVLLPAQSEAEYRSLSLTSPA